jgi:hypothetical protein
MKKDNFEYHERFSQITTQISPSKADRTGSVLRSLSPSPVKTNGIPSVNHTNNMIHNFMIGAERITRDGATRSTLMVSNSNDGLRNLESSRSASSYSLGRKNNNTN